MKISIIASTLLAAMATATPLKRNAVAPRVTLTAVQADINDQSKPNATISVGLNMLQYSTDTVTKLLVDEGSGVGGVDADNVECRMYRDGNGIEPGSAPFTTKSVAYISTNAVSIGSILCYVVEASETS